MENRAKLEDEIALGNTAKHVHTSYLEGFFAKERLNLFTEFCSTDCSEANLVTIKHGQMALDRLELVTLTHIETGRLASIMLADEQE